jgi:hypothetical protein
MGFYNRSGKKLDLDVDNMEKIITGYCSIVYHDDESIFKKYYHNISKDLRLSVEAFDFFKNINNPHFIELYDVYCSHEFYETLNYIFRKELFKVDGYTAKYYSDDSVNVLLEHKDYLLDNLREIEDLINYFTDNKVLVEDLKRDNTILGKDGIVLIDPDMFRMNAKLSEIMDIDLYSLMGRRTNISLLNKNKLLGLVNDLFNIGLLEIAKRNSDLCTEKYIDFDIDETTDITSEVSKKLQLVKKPIDYIVK